MSSWRVQTASGFFFINNKVVNKCLSTASNNFPNWIHKAKIIAKHIWGTGVNLVIQWLPVTGLTKVSLSKLCSIYKVIKTIMYNEMFKLNSSTFSTTLEVHMEKNQWSTYFIITTYSTSAIEGCTLKMI